MGDRLVVSVTAARYVRKGPGRPAHSNEERVFQLQKLRDVDVVYLCEEPTGAEAIFKFRPTFYVKGADYAAKGIHQHEADACYLVGAEVRYTTTEKRSIAELTENFQRRQP